MPYTPLVAVYATARALCLEGLLSGGQFVVL